MPERVGWRSTRRRGRRCAARRSGPRRSVIASPYPTESPSRVRTPRPTVASSDGGPGDRRDPGAQDHGGEQRRRDDVHAGDEAGDAGRRVRQAGRLQDLRDPVEQPEHDRVPPRLRREPARAPAVRPATITTAGDREADGQEVEGRDPVEEVLDQEERAAPAAVIPSSAAVASRVVRRPPATARVSDQVERDRGALGERPCPRSGSIEKTKPRPR